MTRVRIGVLGCGTVGAGFVRLVERERARVRAQFGIELEVGRILVRDAGKERPGIDAALLTATPLDVLDDDCHLFVEAIGGVHSAGSFVRRVLARRRHVVTANKALLAACGRELFALAAGAGAQLGFEASVCGGVPVVGLLTRGLAGDRIESIRGVLNGTTNYILTRMARGKSFAEALLCAQEAGFAEADPALDVSGEDAMQKLRILAELAFPGEAVRRASVTGIEDVVRPGDRTRLVAEARRTAGGIELAVAPRELVDSDPLARLVDEENGVVVRGRAVGEVFISGRGAGSMPTAAALLSDVIEISRRATHVRGVGAIHTVRRFAGRRPREHAST